MNRRSKPKKTEEQVNSKHAPLQTAMGPSIEEEQPMKIDESNTHQKFKDQQTRQVTRKKRAYVDMSQDEIDEVLNREKLFETFKADLDSRATIFQPAPLRRFIVEALAHVNPTLSVSSVTL